LSVLTWLVKLNWCRKTLDLCPKKDPWWARFGEGIYKKKKKKVFTIAVNSNWGYFSKKEVEEKEEEEENSIYGGKKNRNTLSHSLQTWAKYS
jgi:hypothetical protein